MHKTNYIFGYIITHSVANCSEIWKEWYHIIIKFQNWTFLLWFIDCIESLCCGWCKFFFFIPSFRSGSGESLGKCLLAFHNNYFWALMVSGFGPSSLSPTLGKCSEWLPVAERIITPAYHLVCLCGLGKPFWPGQAWYCWQKPGCASTWATALPFSLKTFQDS